MYVKMNPQQWQYAAYKTEGIELTHQAQQVSNSLGERLLQLRFKGKNLAVEVDESELTHIERVALGIHVPSNPEPEEDSPAEVPFVITDTTSDDEADEDLADDE